MKPIVLASSSPRRREILEKTGLNFTVDTVELDERLENSLTPLKLVKKLSVKKAAIAAARHPGSIVIAADTVGFLDGKILGKPRSEADARKMLSFMNGKCHKVVTGFTIVDTVSGKKTSSAVETSVYFRKLSRNEIDAYVRSGEPLDKAGAYAIQGLGALLVEKIEGDYFNVMGLPLSALAIALKKFGVDLLC